MKRFTEGPLFFLVVCILCAGLFVTRLGSWISVKHTLQKKEASLKQSGLSINQGTTSLGSEAAIQGLLGEKAKAARVKRLLSVGVLTDRDEQKLAIEWEADTRSTVQFLRELKQIVGRCEKFHVTSAGAAIVRVDAVFDRGPAAPVDTKETPAVALVRNVFLPLWEPKRDTAAQTLVSEFKKEEKTRQEEQEKLEKERKEQAEREQLQAKKRELETELILTGIVNNGREPLAFLNSRNGGQTVMARNGDVIREARITSIDERKGQIELDYQGKFQVSIKINSGSTGNVQ